MNSREFVCLTMMFVAVPGWLGYMWTELLRIQGGLRRVLYAWTIGFAVMLAAAQLVLVPLVALQKPLTTAIGIWHMALQVLAVANFLLWLVRHSEGVSEGKRKQIRLPKLRRDVWQLLFGVLAVALVLLQAYLPARYQHSDDDDARFIAEEVSAFEHNTMYLESPINAEYMYWDVGEVKKDLTSPWAMFVAMIARDALIPPAVLSHACLPFYLLLLCYAVYALIGQKLFDGDWEKTGMFLILLSALHLAGYTSTHTVASMILLRIWQGKAVCAGLMIPLMLCLFYELMRHDDPKGWIALCYVASTGMCLLSGIGIVTAPVLLFLYGLVDFVCHRSWRRTFALWMASVPCGVFLGYYLI